MADLKRRIQRLVAQVEAQRRAVDIPAANRRVRARLNRKLRDAIVGIGHEWHPLTPEDEAILAADSPAQQEADERALAPFRDPMAGENLRKRLEDARDRILAEEAEMARERLAQEAAHGE